MNSRQQLREADLRRLSQSAKADWVRLLVQFLTATSCDTGRVARQKMNQKSRLTIVAEITGIVGVVIAYLAPAHQIGCWPYG